MALLERRLDNIVPSVSGFGISRAQARIVDRPRPYHRQRPSRRYSQLSGQGTATWFAPRTGRRACKRSWRTCRSSNAMFPDFLSRSDGAIPEGPRQPAPRDGRRIDPRPAELDYRIVLEVARPFSEPCMHIRWRGLELPSSVNCRGQDHDVPPTASSLPSRSSRGFGV